METWVFVRHLLWILFFCSVCNLGQAGASGFCEYLPSPSLWKQGQPDNHRRQCALVQESLHGGVCYFYLLRFSHLQSFHYQGFHRSGISDNSLGRLPLYRKSGCHEKIHGRENRLNASSRREQINRFMISDIKVQ